MGKTIALVGFADNTSYLAKDTKADEIWSLRTWYKIADLPRVDRLFEIHPYEFLHGRRDDTEYIEYLQRAHPFPIYMQEINPDKPSSVVYPLEEVIHNLFVNLRRGEKVIRYFTSTFSYMLALAILENPDRIEIYGFDMAWGTEYQYQKAGAEFMIGVAAGRGIEVYIPEECNLLKARLYGYEALRMITRQYLEARQIQYDNLLSEKMAQLNLASGEWNQRNGNEQANRELWEKIRKLTDEVNVYSGALQAINQLIKQCDLEEIGVSDLKVVEQG